MILAAVTTARAWFAALPSGVKWALAGIALAILIGITWAVWLADHDSEVIERHEQKREQRAAEAHIKTAEERADDAIRNLIAEQAREAAIDRAAASEAARPPEERATMPPTTLALNCERIRQAYSARELAGIAVYQEKCL